MERRQRITQLQTELVESIHHVKALQAEIGMLWEQELAPNVEVELPVTQSAVVGYLTPEAVNQRAIGRVKGE